MRGKQKGATKWAEVDGGSAFIIPVTLLRHPNFTRLSANACKLVLDLGRQYSGFNNGYLSAAVSILEPLGWRSEATIREAVAECIHYGLIQKTRQGGRNRCNLFALTWWKVQEKDGRPLDVRATLQASHDWKETRPAFAKQTRKKNPRHRSGCQLPPQPVLSEADGTAAGASLIDYPRSGGCDSAFENPIAPAAGVL
ncbi:MAG: hypothetical protein WC829_20040 [Hyphomicrobium sp.]|jgi:hypothetical protein